MKDFKGVSKTSFHRQRRGTEKEIAEDILDKFINDPDVEFYSVHWDSKKILLRNGHREERMVVLVKPVDADKPAQYLSAPRTADGKGSTGKDAVIRVLINSNVPLEKCILLGFDTTASNSGIRLGAAVLIERHLATPMLYGGCRHHSAERHVHWADDAVRNMIYPGGEDPWFQRFQNYFPNILTGVQNLQLWEGDEGDSYKAEGAQGCETWWSYQAKKILALAIELNKQDWVREDYQETCELLIVFFKGLQNGMVSYCFTKANAI